VAKEAVDRIRRISERASGGRKEGIRKFNYSLTGYLEMQGIGFRGGGNTSFRDWLANLSLFIDFALVS